MDDVIEMLFELHKGTPRQGPGADAATKKALSFVSLPENPKVLDIGSGCGKQTMVLAKNIAGEITATDIFQPFLDEIKIKAEKAGKTIKTENMDISELKFNDNSFDLIWSEGSIFILGFDAGLKLWRNLLKPNGYMVVSELSWLDSNPPADLFDYWKSEYPGIDTIEGSKKRAIENGYEVLDSFILEKEGWTKEYYKPLKVSLKNFRKKYKEDIAALAVASATDKEMQLYDKYSDYYGYVFYILKKK